MRMIERIPWAIKINDSMLDMSMSKIHCNYISVTNGTYLSQSWSIHYIGSFLIDHE